MQTYQNRRRAPDRTAPPPAQETAPSRSELLHLSGAGAPQPMSPQLREKFEPGFSADFSNIRISRGHIPEGLGVQAVAQGTDILLDESAGMDVLGHELAHVVQQAQGRVAGGYPVVENAALEHEADVMGERVSSGLTAQAGPQNGFGGETMTIAPMSSASAPAQCKSRQEKKDEKTMGKITEAEQRRDAAVAAAGTSLEKRDARKAFANEVDGIVRGMSDRQLHSKQFQSRIVGIASSAANAEMKSEMARDTGSKPSEDYFTVLRGMEIEPEQRSMNTMMYRLMGGTERLRGQLKSGAGPEDRLSSIMDDLSGNEDVKGMLTQFRDETFQGVNKGVMTDPTAQNNAVMSNLFTRLLIRAGIDGAEVGQDDKEASKNAAGVNKLLATDKVTGQLASNQSQAAQRASALLTPAPAVQTAAQESDSESNPEADQLTQLDQSDPVAAMMMRVSIGERNAEAAQAQAAPAPAAQAAPKKKKWWQFWK